MIVIVDYGMGNLGSIRNMFKRLGVPAKLSKDKEEIARAEKLVLPGVGAFGKGMENLKAQELQDVLTKKALEDRVPVLGICLGMQLMTRSSEEADQTGLGWVPAETVHLRKGAAESAKDLKVPHIGWNFIDVLRSHPLFHDLPPDPRYYFVHSYRVECDRAEDIVARASYGPVDITAGFAFGNVAGVQFHPEKSHKFGMKLLLNFSQWNGTDG